MNGNINEFSTEEETPSESINSSTNNILLYRNDQPNIIIEKVLISIYNQNINPDNSSKEELDMGLCFEQVKKLCSKYEEYHIVLLLLKGIRSLIYKYREIILKLPNIEEIKGKENYFEYPPRSNSYKNKFPKGLDTVIMTADFESNYLHEKHEIYYDHDESKYGPFIALCYEMHENYDNYESNN